ncbi:MAG TPA: hypothetical protein VKU41_25805, partial [Polyangiaceae bacterium]|nr:hypothetical protein [Polyangiaceae bacterium]
MRSFRQPRFRFGLALGGVALGGASIAGGCGGQPAQSPGQLVVAIDTDMALPDQVDTIELEVTVGGTTIYDYPIPVGTGPDSQPIPATLTLVAGRDPNAPATIRVLGSKGGVVRTLRQVTSTIPVGRVATLRMPVQWLCDGSAQPVAGADGGIAYQSTCGPGGTCHAGSCVPSSVDPSSLPAYQPQDVFGGGSAPPAKGHTAGACFDVIACMLGGTVETPDDPSVCTIPVPSDPSNVNVALRVANDGICDTTGTTCFVPLDGRSAEGWTMENGRAALPPAVCDRLRTGLVQGIVVSTGCPTKTQSTPPCGAWSSVTLAADASTVATGVDAGPPPTPTLLAATAPEGGTVSACCPLLADSSALYTCLCDGNRPPQLVAIDPTSGAATPAGSLSPRMPRSQYAAALAGTGAGSQVYWVDHAPATDGGSLCPVEAVPVSPSGGSA